MLSVETSKYDTYIGLHTFTCDSMIIFVNSRILTCSIEMPLFVTTCPVILFYVCRLSLEQ